MFKYITKSFLRTIVGLILGIYSTKIIDNKIIKRLRKIIKNQTNERNLELKKYLESRTIEYYEENKKLKDLINKMNNKIKNYKNKLTESYKKEEFKKYNEKIKKYKEKIKIMYKEMPDYKKFKEILENYKKRG